jgi:hypothetical protein
MFHECRVYDGKGKLKTTYDKDQVAFSHWQNTVDSTNQIVISATSNIPPELIKGTKRTLICDYSECKKSFTTTHRKVKVCSDVCGRQVKRQKDIRRRRSRSKNDDFIAPQEYENGFYGYKIKCKECNEISYKKNYKAIFCNSKCLTRHKNLVNVTEKKKLKYTIVCKFCNATAHMKSSYAQYCSDRCRDGKRAERKNTTTKTW